MGYTPVPPIPDAGFVRANFEVSEGPLVGTTFIYSHGTAHLSPRTTKENCRNCGAPVAIPRAAMFSYGELVNTVACEYCGTTY